MRFLSISYYQLPPAAGEGRPVGRYPRKDSLDSKTRDDDTTTRRHYISRKLHVKQCVVPFRRIVEDQSKKIPSFDGCGATSIAKYLTYHRPCLSKTLGEAVVEYAARQ